MKKAALLGLAALTALSLGPLIPLVSERGEPLTGIVRRHWAEFGRNYYSRHDYEAVDVDAAVDLMTHVDRQLAGLPGRRVNRLVVAKADDFAYRDPVDGSLSEHQGLRIVFERNQ